MSAKGCSPPILAAAMEMEIRYILRGFKKSSDSGLKIFEGKIDGQEVCAVISGVGNDAAQRAAQWAASRKPPLVLNVGYGGGLNTKLRTCDVFVPKEVRNLRGERFTCNPGALQIMQGNHQGVLLTHNSFVQTRKEKQQLAVLADAVDMEAFSWCSILAQDNIPFFCAKAISDTVEETFPMDFSPFFTNGNISWKAAAIFARKPYKIFSVLKYALRALKIARPLRDTVVSVFRDR